MPSLTSITMRRRQLRLKRAGRKSARKRIHACSPPFPVHPEGYDPKAADAKKQAEPKK